MILEKEKECKVIFYAFITKIISFRINMDLDEDTHTTIRLQFLESTEGVFLSFFSGTGSKPPG